MLLKPRTSKIRPYILVSLLLAAIGYWSWTEVVELVPPEWAPSHAQPFTVERVVDGDTIVAVHERTGEQQRIRYLHIDAPELTGSHGPQVFAHEATAANRRLVEGRRIWVVPGEPERDEYGRLLGYVFAGGDFINLKLVADGFAEVMLISPNLWEAERFMTAQEAARREGKGLWATVEEDPDLTELEAYVGRFVKLRGEARTVVSGNNEQPFIVRLSVPGSLENESDFLAPEDRPTREVSVTLLIFPEVYPYFPAHFAERMRGERVEAVGLLEAPSGRLQMIIREPGQIRTVERETTSEGRSKKRGAHAPSIVLAIGVND